MPPISCLVPFWEPSWEEMSARARFFEPLLWVLKMSDFVFEGRARPLVVFEWAEEADWARREVSWVVKARDVDEVMSFLLERWITAEGRGAP